MGGTYSVLLMACIYAWLQMYVLGIDIDTFNKILSTIPASKECICRWTEQQYAYPTSKECSELIKFKIGLGQNLVAEKYISVWDFLEIIQAYLECDLNAYVNSTGKDPSIIQGLAVQFKEAMNLAAIIKELKDGKKEEVEDILK